MFLEKVKSDGLAHFSYVIGDEDSAAVIDPRRDVDCYIDIARDHEANITHIFETHKNEDYVIGSLDLAKRTGADIYHGQHLDFQYGHPVEDGAEFEFGDVILKIIETPGHTYESISIAVLDTNSSKTDPVGVFTGDTLFVQDVGRTDFYPKKLKDSAGKLFDSIFKKLLPLGESVIIYPAHGGGSICGSGIAGREFSTLGYERRHNPVLQMTDKKKFVEYKMKEQHYQPAYFKKMEEYNRMGNAPALDFLPNPKAIDTKEFASRMEQGMIVVDLRSPEAFAGAFIRGSLAMPLKMVPGFAGWFLPYDKPIGLVTAEMADIQVAVRYFARLGYDNISCYLEKGMRGWEMSGREYDRIPAIYAGDIVKRLERSEEFTVLDVRSKGEWENGHLPGAQHLFLGELPGRISEVDRGSTITAFCGSGRRAIIAASILKMNGFENVEDCLGSMKACSAIGCPSVA